jgi:uncharacterized protein YggE
MTDVPSGSVISTMPPSTTVTGHGREPVATDRVVFTVAVSSLAPTVDESRRGLLAVQGRPAAAIQELN